MIDYEQLEQESILFPWLDSDCMADYSYEQEFYEIDYDEGMD